MAIKSWFLRLKPSRFHKNSKRDDHKSKPAEQPKNDARKSANSTQPTHSPEKLPTTGSESVKTLSTHEHDSKHPAPNKSTTAIEPKILWDRAYDSLKEDEKSLVEAYEKVLSSELTATTVTSVSEPNRNLIAQGDPELRRTQMRQLVYKGLAKTEREANVKQGIGQTVDVIFAANELVSSSIKNSPEASLAWTGITFGLQMIANPIKETKANREGIHFVVQIMKWYWDLSSHVLEERDPNGNSYAKLRSGLEEQAIELYKELLAYQMKSVCSYYQNRGLVFLKDLIQLHGWDGQVSDIIKIATTLSESISQYNMQQNLDFQQQGSEALKNINKILQELPSLQRDFREKDKDDECLRDLRISDPEDDMERIETSKGKLLPESSKWIIQHPYFTDWRHNEVTRLLWMRAEPGKGKTMLMISIIKELRRIPGSSHPSFFFCQETDANLNNATAVLRGLTSKLAEQQPFLMPYLREKYDTAGKKLFEDSNAFVALSKILYNMLRDIRLSQVTLIVDALDECKSGLKQLLEFINESLSDPSCRVKWIVSSRPNNDIVAKLSRDKRKKELHLQKDAEAEISHAVKAYIDCRTHDLIAEYDDKYTNIEILEELPSIESSVAEELYRKADNTFLWVALVFQQIDPSKCEVDKIFEFVRQMPTGLYDMYNRMMEQIFQQESNYSDYCKKVLLVAANSYRPLGSSEMKTLADLSKYVVLRDVIQLCGLLSFREEDEVIYFVHQSAKDYLIHHAKPEIMSQLFTNGCVDGHRQILSQSLKSMSDTLKRDIYDLKHPGFCTADVHPPSPDPLAKIRYACVYWVEHLYEMEASNHELFLHDNKDVDVFLRRHLLHWLEALSLMKNMPSGLQSITKLNSLIRSVSQDSKLFELARDTYRFTLFNRGIIENNPLQVYHSALVFSPTSSLTRQIYQDDVPSWVTVKTGLDSKWGTCLQTLEDHGGVVTAVAFSPDNMYIASGSWDKTIRIWDANYGNCLQTLKGHDSLVSSVGFSPDSTCIVSGGYDTIRTWDIKNGTCTQIFKCDGFGVTSVAFNFDGSHIISGCNDEEIRIWDASNGTCLQNLKAHDRGVASVALSPDGTYIASVSKLSSERVVKVWDANSGACLHTLKGHTSSLNAVGFSPDGQYIASGSSDKTIKIWDYRNEACIRTLICGCSINSLAFSPCGSYIVSSYRNNGLSVWDTSNGALLQTLEGHSCITSSAAFSPDGTHIVTGSWDKTVKIWEWDSKNKNLCLEVSDHHSDRISSMVFSSDHKKIASGSSDKTVKIWDTSNGTCSVILKGHNGAISSGMTPPDASDQPMGYFEKFSTKTMDFSPDETCIVSASTDKTAKIWDVSTGACLQTLRHESAVHTVAFSPSGVHVASGVRKSIILWDAIDGACILDNMKTDGGSIRSVVFSHNGAYIASGYSDRIVRIWDARNGNCLETLKDQGKFVKFDTATSCFYTESGVVPWQSNTRNNTGMVKISQNTTKYEMSDDGTWLTCNDNNVLWLPPDYRRSCPAAISNDMVLVIGTIVGRVAILNLSPMAPF